MISCLCVNFSSFCGSFAAFCSCFMSLFGHFFIFVVVFIPSHSEIIHGYVSGFGLHLWLFWTFVDIFVLISCFYNCLVSLYSYLVVLSKKCVCNPSSI